MKVGEIDDPEAQGSWPRRIRGCWLSDACMKRF